MQRVDSQELLIRDNPRIMHSVREWIAKSARDFCSYRTLKKRVPIVGWLPKYKFDLLLQDIIAGISVGLTAIPQGIAYADVAGLSPEYGLYSGFMGVFVYLIFGSCKDLTIGPTALLALITQKYVKGYGPDFAVLLTFLCGSIVFLMGVFQLGFLIEFISMPVTAGFVTASAITIGFTQMHGLIGFKGSSNTFLDVIINFIKNIKDVEHPWDAILGISTIIVLLLLRELRKWGSRTSTPDMSLGKSLLYKFNWLISLARNAIVVIIGCVLAWSLEQYGYKPFTLTKNITQGFPPVGPPPFSTDFNGKHYTFLEMIGELNTSIITLSFIIILEAVAIAKAFSNGKIVDATQEMLALGLGNIVGSFFRSMPTTGSFTRTVVNNSSGVQTPMGGVFTGAVVLMALSFLTGAFEYIPKSVLAGLIICAMIFMTEFEIVPLLWRCRKIELVPFFVTLLICLFWSLELGIVSGVVVNIIITLAPSARPNISVEMVTVNSQEVMIVTPAERLIYCSADHFTKKVQSVAYSKEYRNNTNFIVIIDGSQMKAIDVTVAKSIKVLIESLKMKNQKIYFWKMSPAAQIVLEGVYPKISDLFVEQPILEEVVKYAGYEIQSVSTQ